MVSVEMGIRKYKLVRRGPKYCVRVKGIINTTKAYHWCRERNMSYHIKQHWNTRWDQMYLYEVRDWDYSFIFDKEYEATAFMIGFL
jgi:hypothetical protein